MKFSRRLKNQIGFTLMETLLAITLFAIVSASTYSVFSMGLQIWKRSKGSTFEERRLLLAMEKMGKDIRSVTPFTPPPEKFSISDKIKIEFKGTSSQVMLPALFTGNESQIGGYGRVTYKWNQTTQEICVQQEGLQELYRNRNLPCKPLAGKVSKLRFRYWLQSGISKSYSWYNDWDGDSAFPKAIEITAELASEKSEDLKRSYKKTVLVPTGGIGIV